MTLRAWRCRLRAVEGATAPPVTGSRANVSEQAGRASFLVAELRAREAERERHGRDPYRDAMLERYGTVEDAERELLPERLLWP